MRRLLLAGALGACALSPAVAQAQPMLTPRAAHTAASMALDATLGELLYKGVGSATSGVGHCRVKGRRAVCPGRVHGTVNCTVTMHVLVTGTTPASEPGARLLIWADRLRCGA